MNLSLNTSGPLNASDPPGLCGSLVIVDSLTTLRNHTSGGTVIATARARTNSIDAMRTI